MTNIIAAVAQLVERVAVNHMVAGSNPAGGVFTPLFLSISLLIPEFQFLESKRE